MKGLIFVFIVMCTIAHGQIDNIGAGRSLALDGIDDLIEFGDNYHDLNLPFTVSAWMYIDPSVNYPVPIFVTNDNNPLYRGFWFFISPDLMWCEIGDGIGSNSPLFRRGKQAIVSQVTGKWINVSAVMRSPTDVDLYLNGINVGGERRGDSESSMASSFIGDRPKVGYFLSNGVTYRLKGMIDEVRLWNIALTGQAVRDGMCSKLTGHEPGLIGYWGFDELSGAIVNDRSPNNFNGTIIGNPLKVYSGAPIGDISAHQYQSNWSGKSIEWETNGTLVGVQNITGNPEGIHIYNVFTGPSQNSGLNLETSINSYCGVFLASLDDNNLFDLNFTEGKEPCKIFSRSDNSNSIWNPSILPIIKQVGRGEYIWSGQKFHPDIGEDILSCDKDEVILESNIVDAEVSLIWSTGETTSRILVNKTGDYWIRATSPCGVSVDSVHVSLLKQPHSFSLGEDIVSCNLNFVPLGIAVDDPETSVLWSTGETTTNITVNKTGKYWVRTSNLCGEKTDSILIKVLMPPADFSLGQDMDLCPPLSMKLEPMSITPDVEFEWQDGSILPSFSVNEFGKYSLAIKNECGMKSDTIIFSNKETLIKNVPNVITPNGDNFNEYFVIESQGIGHVAVKILNRWGKEVYESKAYVNDWNGGNLSSGVYFYAVDADCTDPIYGVINIIK